MARNDYSLTDVTRMLTNRHNSKTMDYYFLRAAGIQLDAETDSFKLGTGTSISTNGTFYLRISSPPTLLQESAHISMDTGKRQVELGKLNKKNTYTPYVFTVHLFPHQTLPISRDVKIAHRKLHSVKITNPDAWKKSTVQCGMPPHTYSYEVVAPPYKEEPKYVLTYARSPWKRKHALNVSTQA